VCVVSAVGACVERVGVRSREELCVCVCVREKAGGRSLCMQQAGGGARGNRGVCVTWAAQAAGGPGSNQKVPLASICLSHLCIYVCY